MANSFYYILYVVAPYIAVDTFLYSTSTFCMFLLYASKKFRQTTVITLINSLSKYPAALFLVFSLGLNGIVLGLIVGDAVTMLLYFYVLLPKFSRIHTRSIDLKSVFNYSIPLYGSMILNFLSTKLYVYLLMFFSTLYTVGIYSPAIFVASTIFVVISSLDYVILPYTAREKNDSGTNSRQQRYL
jgi:O-antigen/teichoic acid export membrane protein